jgi:hypothetical protein
MDKITGTIPLVGSNFGFGSLIDGNLTSSWALGRVSSTQ